MAGIYDVSRFVAKWQLFYVVAMQVVIVGRIDMHPVFAKIPLAAA
jgi:hypothetical protein